MNSNAWPETSVAALCDSVDYGYTTSADMAPVGPKFLRITDITKGYIDWHLVPFCKISPEEKLRFQLNPGDVVIARTGATTGTSAYISEPPDAVFASYLVRLKIASRAEPRFVAYFLKSPQYWSYIHGVLGDKSAQPNASAKTLTQARLPVPPRAEQKEIARILGNLDNKIDLNRQTSTTLESLARTIFKSWFVDFDPIGAKSAACSRFGMDARTAKLFPRSFENKGAKRIPAGWETGSILRIASLLSGGTPKTDRKEYWNGSVPWASAADVSQARQTFLIDTERTITDQGLSESATQVIPTFSTVVVARGATTGRMVLFGRETAMNQTCYALSSKTQTPFFLYCLLRNEIEGLVHAAHGSVFDTITTSTFESSDVVLPPQSVMENFQTTVRPFFERVLHNSIESETLGEIRDTLLPKLISGEIHIKHAEKLTEAMP